MIKIVTSKANGYVEFELTDNAELEQLPKRNVLNGSIAMVRNASGVKRQYTFVQMSEDVDGEWK